MLWTDKYRPKTLAEVVGNGNEKKKIEMWVSKWKEGIPQKPLLLVGPAGIGKTTLAHVIANEFSEYIELNASDKRSYDIIMNTVGESATTKSLFGDNYKVIILDEVDGIHGNNDHGGVRAIGQIIKNAKHPLIMNANDFYSKRLTSIKPKCHVLKMKKVHTNSVGAVLRRICKKEDIDFDPDAVKELAKRSNGDMRSALNTLQALCETTKSLKMEDLDSINHKDDRSNIFDAVTAVMKSKNPNHVKKAMFESEEDPSLVLEYIAENIPREYERKSEIKEAYEYASKADIFFGRTRSSRNYGYWKYASDFMSVGVAKSKKDTYRKFSKIQTPGTFSIMSKNRAKRNLRDQIAEKMSKKLHMSHSVAISMFPYFEIMFENDEVAWEISDYLELEDDEIKRFRKRKIPKKVVTKKEKEKALLNKKIEEENKTTVKKTQTKNTQKTEKTQTKNTQKTEKTQTKNTQKTEKTQTKNTQKTEKTQTKNTQKTEKTETTKQVSLFNF